jgi:hypothetical protein
MRYIIFILFLISFKLLPAQKWEHLYGSPYKDDIGLDVVQDYDNGYLITIGTETFSCWLIKTDINGSLLWQKNFIDEVPHNDMFFNVIPDEDGNIYLLGWRWIEFESGWPLIVKLDSCGEQVWCRQFIDDEYDWGWFQDALLLDDGSILGLLHMESWDQIDMVFFYRITPDGELLWKKSYASKNNYPLIHSRTPLYMQLINNIYIISGYCYYAYPNNPSHGYLRPLFIGVDALFEEQFVLPFGMADSIPGKAFSSIAINDTLIMGVGQHWLLTNKNIFGNSLLMFYDIEGNEYYFKDIPNQSIGANIKGNWIRHIEYIDDSLLFATSYFGENYQGNDGGEFVIDTSGHVYRHASHPNTVANSSLLKTHDGKFVIVTSQKTGNYWDVLLYKVNDTLGTDTLYTGSYVYDSLCPYQIPSDTINLAGCLVTTNITNTPPPEVHTTQLHIFPNPASNELTIRYRIPGPGYQVFIYDLFGRKQDEILIPKSQYQVRLDISDYPAGVYVAVMKDEKGVVARGKFVKH